MKIGLNSTQNLKILNGNPEIFSGYACPCLPRMQALRVFTMYIFMPWMLCVALGFYGGVILTISLSFRQSMIRRQKRVDCGESLSQPSRSTSSCTPIEL